MRIQYYIKSNLVKFHLQQGLKYKKALARVLPEAKELLIDKIKWYVGKPIHSWSPKLPRSARIGQVSGLLHDSIRANIEESTNSIYFYVFGEREAKLYKMFDKGVKKRWRIPKVLGVTLAIPEDHLRYQSKKVHGPWNGSYFLPKVWHPGFKPRNMTQKAVAQCRKSIISKFRKAVQTA